MEDPKRFSGVDTKLPPGRWGEAVMRGVAESTPVHVFIKFFNTWNIAIVGVEDGNIVVKVVPTEDFYDKDSYYDPLVRMFRGVLNTGTIIGVGKEGTYFDYEVRFEGFGERRRPGLGVVNMVALHLDGSPDRFTRRSARAGMLNLVIVVTAGDDGDRIALDAIDQAMGVVYAARPKAAQIFPQAPGFAEPTSTRSWRLLGILWFKQFVPSDLGFPVFHCWSLRCHRTKCFTLEV